MIKKKILTLIAAIFIAFFMLQGCDQMTKHRVLSFFFDGVPPIQKTKKTTDTPPEIKPTDRKEFNTAAKRNTQDQTKAPVELSPTTVQHPPYAVKMCYGCHQTTKRTIAAPVGFTLLDKKLRICLRCHDYMSQEDLGKTFAWVHAPVQFGACLECHHPHETANPYMLQIWPIQKLCFKCHNENRLLKTVIHEEIDDTACTECHDPHGSQARFMLKTE